MSKRSVSLLIQDICEAMEKINRYREGLDHDRFISDEKTVDAVVRNLEIMGEAANRLPKDFLDEHREIEWNKMAGLRHRIVHEYFGIDLEIIWSILENDLPVFWSSLQDLRQRIIPG